MVVTPAVYGTNNECTLDAIRQPRPRARGVALIDSRTTPRQLVQLGRGGVRGIRLNFESLGVTDPTAADQ